MSAILKTEKLRVEYIGGEIQKTSKVALHGLDLEVRAGEVFGFLRQVRVVARPLVGDGAALRDGYRQIVDASARAVDRASDFARAFVGDSAGDHGIVGSVRGSRGQLCIPLSQSGLA